MKVERKELGKKLVELTVELANSEITGQLQKAAERISQKNKIEGFRPGKAPYDIIKARFGEMAIYQEALQDILQDSFWKAVQQEKLTTVGQPEINVTKMAPDNDFVYSAKVALLPDVTLGQWTDIKVDEPEVMVVDEDVEKVIKDFSSMQAVETAVDRPAKENDKVEVDFEVYVDKVMLEGGSGKSYPLVIGSQAMIPGFEDQLIGLKAGEKKKFKLKFPDKYFQNHLSGKEAEFSVEVKSVLDRQMPKIDDDWAKKLGAPDLAGLKNQLLDNLKAERQQKATMDWERQAIEAIVAKSQFSDLPDVLVDSEVEKMKHELRHGIENQGMKWDKYLENLKKSEQQLIAEFRPQANERIKAALVLRKLAEENKLTAEPGEVDEEIKKQEELYGSNPQAMQNIHNPGYRQHLENVIINRKVVKTIKERIGKK